MAALAGDGSTPSFSV